MIDTVGLYCRISIDKTGRKEGVKAQERWGREYAEKTWPGCRIRVFVDNHVSAARNDVRPGYDQLRAAIQAGEITQLWTVEQSRLERREGPWFELAAELDAAGIAELHTRRDGIVRVRDDVAGIKAVISAGERRRMIARVNDRLDVRAAEGLPAGSRYFGYRRGVDEQGRPTLIIEPEEAEAVRWAADAVLSGWSLTNIGRELRARGHRGAQGGKFNTSSVHKTLTSAALAGLRVHRGEIVGRGNWEPILSEDVWHAVRARLSSSRRIRTAHGAEFEIPADQIGRRPARKYLITGGLARCGVCGAALSGAVKTLRNGDRRPYLSCARAAGGRGCVGMMLDSAQEYIIQRLLNELDKPEFLAAVTADDHAGRRDDLTDALSVIDNQRTELAKMWSSGGLSTDEWQTARTGLDAREQRLRAELAAIPVPTERINIDDVRQAWPAMTLDEQRQLLRMFIAAVLIHPATPGTRTFDPTRITIEWRAT